ncbi:molybdopterin-binding protein [Telmatospirillum sp. J64-1]|uniref:competence/damage-inducible protein A n=1 Tax=Telmatospirillum sp. J64-1 TaxID=2502183 RepID=UPI00115F5616|nr:molybdopterin-binding protein [Telmatospirillum sp. J64-1]
MKRESEVTAAILVIGNEILSGRTRDANVQFLAAALNDDGVRLAEVRIIPDDHGVIIAALNELRARHSYVFTTGGIGPTHDDITSEAVAQAFDVELELNPEAVRRLEAYYKSAEQRASGGINDMRLRMARIPAGAELVDNPISAAPGYRIGNVFVLAGVPRIMQAMYDFLRPQLVGGKKMLSQTVTVWTPEGTLAAGLAEIQSRFPRVEIGSYPFIREDRLGAAIVLRCADAALLAEAAEEVRQLAQDLGADWEDGEG